MCHKKQGVCFNNVASRGLFFKEVSFGASTSQINFYSNFLSSIIYGKTEATLIQEIEDGNKQQILAEIQVLTDLRNYKRKKCDDYYLMRVEGVFCIGIICQEELEFEGDENSM